MVALIGAQAIWVWQLRVLDERARLRFLTSWMVTGMVVVNAVILSVLVSALLKLAFLVGNPARGLENIPAVPLVASLTPFPVAMGLTNLYLRWRDGR